MKRSEIASIVFIAAVSILLAFFITQAIFGGSANESVKVKTIEPITATVLDPDPAIFNTSAINPTYEVTIVGTESEPESQ